MWLVKFVRLNCWTSYRGWTFTAGMGPLADLTLQFESSDHYLLLFGSLETLRKWMIGCLRRLLGLCESLQMDFTEL